MASKAIRGITVEIGGDTTKLGKAIEDSEKKSRSLQSELKQVDKLLKFDPTNVELLAQKQEILTSAIAETTSTLETLESAQDQVVAQFESGAIGEDQYRAFQREIITTKSKLESLTTELEAVQPAIDGVGTEASDSATTLSKLTDTIGDQEAKLSELKDEYTNVVLEQGKNSEEAQALAKEITSLNDELSDNKKKLSDAESEADDLTDAFNDAGEAAENSDGGFTIMSGALADLTSNAIQGAVGAIKDFLGSLFELSEATEEYRTMQSKLAGSAYTFAYDFEFASEKYAQFYKYLGDDMAATNAITNLMGIGTSTENLSALVDGATAAWATYGDSINVESLTEAINETITCGRVTGSFADTINWAEMSAGGLSNALSDHADIQKAYNKAIAAGVPVEDAFNEALGKITSQSQRADVVAKFLNNTYGESKDIYDEMNASILDANESELALKDTQAELGAAVEPVNTAMTNLKNQALQAIVPLVQKAADGFLNLLTWLKEHPTAMQIVTAIIIALAAAFGVLATALGISALITGVQKAFALLNTTLLTNPITIVVAAIAALVAAFVYLWNNCEGFRNFWIGLWDNIVAVVGPVWTTITGYFSQAMEYVIPILEALWIAIQGVWDGAVLYFQTLWENIKVIFEFAKTAISSSFVLAWDLIKIAWDTAVGYFTAVWESIEAVFSVVVVFLFGAFNTAWTLIKSVWSNVSAFFSAVWETIKGIFSVVKSVLTGNWRDAWEGIKGIVRTWANYFRTVWNNIKSVFAAVAVWFTSTFSAAWDAIKSIVSTWATYFKLVWNNIKNAFSSVRTWFRTIFNSAWTAIKGVFSNWGEFFSGLWDTIKETFSTLGTKLGDAIGDSVKSGINGILSWVESTVNKAIGLINGAIDIINKVPGVSVSHVETVSIPRLAKGGIVDSPTLAEIGENGREAILPLENNLGYLDTLARNITERMPNQPVATDEALLSKLDRIYDRLNRLQIVLDSGTLVGETLDRIDAGLAEKQLLNARGG